MSPPGLDSGLPAYLRAFGLKFRDRLIESRCPQVAASLAFTTLLALVPLLTVGLILFASLPGFANIAESLQTFLMQNLLPATAGKIIATYAVQFTQKATNLTLIGTSIVIVTAVMLVLTIDKAFNQIWAVAHRRPLLARLSMYWVGLTIGPMVLAVAVALLGQIASLSLGLIGKSDPWFHTALARGTAVGVLAALFTLLYMALPNRPVKLRHALAGGLLAAALLSLLQRLFAIYLAQFPTYTLIYGTFAALPTFLLWLYLSWLVVLVCAVAVAVLPETSLRGVVRQPFAGEHILGALQLLDCLDDAQRSGRTPEIEALAKTSGLGLARTADLLESMLRAGWVANADSGGWLLTIRCDALPLGELRRKLALSPAGLSATGDPIALALAERLGRLQGPMEDSVADMLAEARRAKGHQIG